MRLILTTLGLVALALASAIPKPDDLAEYHTHDARNATSADCTWNDPFGAVPCGSFSAIVNMASKTNPTNPNRNGPHVTLRDQAHPAGSSYLLNCDGYISCFSFLPSVCEVRANYEACTTENQEGLYIDYSYVTIRPTEGNPRCRQENTFQTRCIIPIHPQG